MLQNVLVFVCVGAAAFYMVRHWWLTSRNEKGCGGCGSCGKADKMVPAPKQLVQIDLGGTYKPQGGAAPKSREISK